MVKIRDRMVYRDGRIIDFTTKPKILERLKKMGAGERFIPAKEIYENLKGFSDMGHRIFSLEKQSYLIKIKLKKNGTIGRPGYGYKFSQKSLAYLKKYGSFLNTRGYLFRKEKDDSNGNLDGEEDVEGFFKRANQIKSHNNQPKINIREYQH